MNSLVRFLGGGGGVKRDCSRAIEELRLEDGGGLLGPGAAYLSLKCLLLKTYM